MSDSVTRRSAMPADGTWTRPAADPYIVYSNYLEIGRFDTVHPALRFALDESEKYDDVIVIDAPGTGAAFMVRHGQAYRLGRPIAARKTAAG